MASPNSSPSPSSTTPDTPMPFNNADEQVPLCTCPQPAPCPPSPLAIYTKYPILLGKSYLAAVLRRRFSQRFLEKYALSDLHTKHGLIQQVFLIRETESVGEGPLAPLLKHPNASKEVLVLMQIWGKVEEMKPEVVEEEKKWAREFFEQCVQEGIVGKGREVKGGGVEERQTRETCTIRHWENVKDTLENVRRSGCKYSKIECEDCGGVVV
ncbi:MAG: hypothetical protein M1835_001415 [Candelina submexicana]|nr:MAG: hypothetical protein M1835_001415 [Candelina submexicana]